jgi:hypothetical protein
LSINLIWIITVLREDSVKKYLGRLFRRIKIELGIKSSVEETKENQKIEQLGKEKIDINNIARKEKIKGKKEKILEKIIEEKQNWLKIICSEIVITFLIFELVGWFMIWIINNLIKEERSRRKSYIKLKETEDNLLNKIRQEKLIGVSSQLVVDIKGFKISIDNLNHLENLWIIEKIYSWIVQFYNMIDYSI